MRLAEFIRQNTETISREWERFAATLLPNEEFTSSILRDGVTAMLLEIARDMDSDQNSAQQQEKSQGEQIAIFSADDNAAEEHAMARIRMGLTSKQLISEFRALRATVLRLWQESLPLPEKQILYEMTRFNEAVDQTLTEAAVRYVDKTEQSREIFLGILGHDLRTPLAAISGFAELIHSQKMPERNAMFARQISISTTRMAHMITDLIELTRVQLGGGITIAPTKVNIKQNCEEVLAELKAIYEERVFQLEADAILLTHWDKPRISQVLTNLLANAAQHSPTASVIQLKAVKTKDSIELSVHNTGPAISPSLIPNLFDRFVQGQAGIAGKEIHAGNLGLGLYIVKEIVAAHGGKMMVTSSDAEGTIFTAILPIIG